METDVCFDEFDRFSYVTGEFFPNFEENKKTKNNKKREHFVYDLSTISLLWKCKSKHHLFLEFTLYQHLVNNTRYKSHEVTFTFNYHRERITLSKMGTVIERITLL